MLDHDGTAVAFAVDHDQLAFQPRAVDAPWRVKGATDIETAVDKERRDAAQAVGVLDDSSFSSQLFLLQQ